MKYLNAEKATFFTASKKSCRIARPENNAEFASEDLKAMHEMLRQRQPGESQRAAQLLASHQAALRTGRASHG